MRLNTDSSSLRLYRVFWFTELPSRFVLSDDSRYAGVNIFVIYYSKLSMRRFAFPWLSLTLGHVLIRMRSSVTVLCP